MRRLTLLWAVLVAVLAGVGLAGASSAGSAQARWVITDLGTLGGRFSHAYAINEHGQVVGSSGVNAKVVDAMGYEITHAFLWQSGKMRDLGSGPRGFNSTVASLLNDRGQIVVSSERIVPTGNTEGTVRSIAYLWERGRTISLGSFGGKLTAVAGINERGQVVGRGTTRSDVSHAFLWQGGKMRDLGRGGRAIAINNRGQIVLNGVNDSSHAAVWQNGKTIDLGTLGGDGSEAVALNEHGQIAGMSYTGRVDKKGMLIQHLFLWQNGEMRDLGMGGGVIALNAKGEICEQVGVRSFRWQSGKLTDLGTLGSSGKNSYTTARAMNARGQIVGGSMSKTGQEHAFVWENGKMTDLGTLGGQVSDATAINDRGQTIGVSETKTGAMHAVLWTLKTGS